MESWERRAERLRATMVDHQLRRRGIRDAGLLAAMGAVPRELFVPDDLRQQAYHDSALPIGEGQTISQPYMVARTCELARVQPGDKVLEVGAGSGYQAAVLGMLARQVVAIELVEALARRARGAIEAAGLRNVEIRVGDGSLGDPDGAPYDVIVVAAGAPEPPETLVSQLAVGGRMVIPVGPRFMQRLRVLEKDPDGSLEHSDHDACVFVPLVGAHGWQAESG